MNIAAVSITITLFLEFLKIHLFSLFWSDPPTSRHHLLLPELWTFLSVKCPPPAPCVCAASVSQPPLIAAPDLTLTVGPRYPRPRSGPGVGAQPSPRPCPDPPLSPALQPPPLNVPPSTPLHPEIDRCAIRSKGWIWNPVKLKVESDWCEIQKWSANRHKQPPTFYNPTPGDT